MGVLVKIQRKLKKLNRATKDSYKRFKTTRLKSIMKGGIDLGFKNKPLPWLPPLRVINASDFDRNSEDYWPVNPMKCKVATIVESLQGSPLRVYFRNHWSIIKLLLETPIGGPDRKSKRFVRYCVKVVLPRILPALERFYKNSFRIFLVKQKYYSVMDSYRYSGIGQSSKSCSFRHVTSC